MLVSQRARVNIFGDSFLNSLPFRVSRRQSHIAGSRKEEPLVPRLARVVVPGLPYHVTQRGNRRERTFFEGADARRAGVHCHRNSLSPQFSHRNSIAKMA
jgi:hypothetical protein